MNSPGNAAQPADRSCAGRLLDTLVSKWIDSVHQRKSKKELTVAVNGPDTWRAFANIEIHMSMKLRSPVVLRFLLTDQPANVTASTLSSLQADYDTMKKGNSEQDFLFLLIRKATRLPEGYRVVSVNKELSPGLRDILSLHGGEMLYQPEVRQDASPNQGDAAAAKFQAFVEHFRILCVSADDVADLTNVFNAKLKV